MDISVRAILGKRENQNLADKKFSLTPSIKNHPRLPAIRSALSADQFFKRLEPTLDQKSSIWVLTQIDDEPIAVMDGSSTKKKYVGEISKNQFCIRRPLIAGGKGVGVGISGKVIPMGDGCMISVFSEPSPGQNMLILITETQFAVVLLMTFIVPLVTTQTMAQILQNTLAYMALSFPLFLGGLFLKIYFREYLIPDRELFEHVAGIAQCDKAQPADAQ